LLEVTIERQRSLHPTPEGRDIARLDAGGLSCVGLAVRRPSS